MKLLVLWKTPAGKLPENACVLSFLLPADEESLQVQSSISLLRGRELSLKIRSAALEVYQEVVAQIGAAPVEGGKTLRQTMTRPGWASLWWFHNLSARDSESDPLYGWILQTLIIQFVAREKKVQRIALIGGPHEIAAVLQSAFQIEERESQPTSLCWNNAPGALGSRLPYLLRFIRHRFALTRFYRLPAKLIFDVVFSCFWDWSFKRDEKTGGFADHYFKRVPSLLETQGISTGRFAWFDPYYQPSQKGRSLRSVLGPLAATEDVVILQALLKVSDAVRALLDLMPLRSLHKTLRNREFERAFIWKGTNWRPLFEPALRRGCLNAQIPHCVLVSQATERAVRRYRPRLTLSFLEHFPYARAHYDGVRRADVGALNWTMQHAGVCHEKTFYFLHPRSEFGGEPDGCRVPAPERVFAMGGLARDIFLECGYAPEQVTLAGSARYDHIRLARAPGDGTESEAKRPQIRVLLACSLAVDAEIAMVEAAGVAAKSVPDVVLRVRNHPTNRVDEHPRFASWRSRMEVSKNSLEADVCWADLVLFSYSTVAEEAFLQGKPVWQWLPLGFNGSALVEVAKIPQFASVTALREALKNFPSNPQAWVPGFSLRKLVAERLFHPPDGLAAERIARYCAASLKRRSSQGTVEGTKCG